MNKGLDKGPTSGFATASLVLGILSLIFGFIPVFGWIIFTLAVIYGFVALRKIKKNKNLGGRKLAIAGIAMGFISLILSVVVSQNIVSQYFSNTSISNALENYDERANLQCSTYCDSISISWPFLVGKANLSSDRSTYDCTCIKDVGEPNQKAVGSRPIDRSKLAEDEKLIKAVLPYSSAVKTSDVNIRAKAGQIVKDCPSGDKECSVNAVYRYITESLRYVNDPKGRQIIQSPEETLAINGGDCEDLSILADSYLENLGIETATILTPDHAYAAACNLNVTTLQQYATKSLNDYTIKQWTKSSSSGDQGDNFWGVQYVTIDGELYYKYTPKDKIEQVFNGPGYWSSIGYWADFNTSYFDSVRIDYKIKADDNLNVYILKSEQDINSFKNGNSFEDYKECSGSGVSFSNSCKGLKSFGALAIQNGPDSGKSRFILDVSYYLKPKPENQFKAVDITTYDLNQYGIKCVVIDPTQGPYEYPGSDRSINKTRVMVTNLAGEVKDFGYGEYYQQFE